jgi:REP element-mobilizing transposase RayT
MLGKSKRDSLMTRSWLITSTTYGTWLPGDARGFVSTVQDETGTRKRHNAPQTPYDRDMPELRASARRLLKGNPVWLLPEQAPMVLAQFQETATYRGWELLAVAIMPNHFHVVLTAAEDVHSTAILRDLKSYAARALNRVWPRPTAGTWWTESGSRRWLPNESALAVAIEYVRRQLGALLIWIAGEHPAPERGASAP